MDWTPEAEALLLTLPLHERARLADRLLLSLSDSPDDPWLQALDEEVSERRQALKDGKLSILEGQAVLANFNS